MKQGFPQPWQKPQKKSEGKDCELKAAQRMICGISDLSNTIITADPLHCQRKTAQDIVSRGGEFIFQVKNNQKTVRENAAIKTASLKPLFSKTEKGHGRIDCRNIAVQAVDPMDLNFPHVETVIKISRKSSASKNPEKYEISYYISSAPADAYTPAQWMRLIRGHWGGIEIRNHWRKDACLFEDKTRSRNPNIVATLAMMRNALLFFFSNQDIHSNLPGFVEAIAADPDKSYSMIKAKL